MFEEAQLYSPVTQSDDGKVEVHLGKDHPGFNDPDYRERRNEIAAAAMVWEPGAAGPAGRLHRAGGRDLAHGQRASCTTKHEKYAVREYLEAKARLGLPEDRVPQLDEVTARLEPLTGFRYDPAPGLVPLREFYGSLADRVFHSTQYVRHPSEPLYTPEPDVIHEVIGHGNMLASPRFAAFKKAAGEAARRVETDDALQLIADIFWFTMEFGVMREDGELRAYGAGILSSYGEIEEFRHMEIRPIDLAEMGVDRVRHHQVPAGAVLRGVDGRARGGRRRLLRDRRRRHAGGDDARSADKVGQEVVIAGFRTARPG